MREENAWRVFNVTDTRARIAMACSAEFRRLAMNRAVCVFRLIFARPGIQLTVYVPMILYVNEMEATAVGRAGKGQSRAWRGGRV